jgi:hypothetical protein
VTSSDQAETNNNGSEPDDAAYAKDYSHLLPGHLQLLRDSGISAEVARARGYRSIETKAGLKNYGFSESQRIVPSLLIPHFDVIGRPGAGYQHRPDRPRAHDGHLIKYESPHGARLVLDVHPFLSRRRTREDGEPGLPLIADAKVPFFITEGTRKGDSGVTIGLCAISINGVWAWRGETAGGLSALADWENIALAPSGRRLKTF